MTNEDERLPPPTDPAHDDVLVKILIDTEGHWSGATAERLWAAETHESHYELRNTPFYAYGLNWGDIVDARLLDDGFGEIPWFRAIVRRGGHKTLRIFFLKHDEAVRQRVLGELNARNVSYEYAHGSLYALDVMPEANYEDVIQMLDGLCTATILEWELGSDCV